MLHVIGLMFFSSLVVMTGIALAALLYRSRRDIAQALGVVPVPTPAVTPGVSRVRVRYVSHGRRVMPSLREAA